MARSAAAEHQSIADGESEGVKHQNRRAEVIIVNPAPVVASTCGNGTKMLAFGLIAAGVLGLAIGGFSYTRETHEAQVGPIELSVKDRQSFNIPVWLGAGVMFAGVLLLVVRAES